MSEKKTAGQSVKTYETFGNLLKAKSAGALPRGIKAHVHPGGAVEFKDSKGNQIASIDITAFAKGELKRHGFTIG